MMEYTIVENFNIQGADRVQEFNEFLTTKMNNSSLRAPIKSRQRNHSYSVSLRCNLKDAMTLETLLNSWTERDNRATLHQTDTGLVSWLKKLMKVSSWN